MRILIPRQEKDEPNTGKWKFLERLRDALVDRDDCIVGYNPDREYDIYLDIVQFRHPNVKAKKKVLRLNGVYNNLDWPQSIALNRNIATEIKKADAIVYQSKFSKKLNDIFCCSTDKTSAIIYNGAPILPDSSNMVWDFTTDLKKPLFAAVSRWRPHKRLEDTIESFLLANIEDATLVVAGDLEKSNLSQYLRRKYKETKRVIFTGRVNQIAIYSLFCDSVASIHLAWQDCCPNSVVEAISCGCPVITNNIGGTQEVVRPSNGMCLEIDEPYNYEMCHLYHPPKINRNIVAEALRDIYLNPHVIYNKHVDIVNIADQYYNFFKKVLNE